MPEQPEYIVSLVEEVLAARLPAGQWLRAKKAIEDIEHGDVEISLIKLEHLLDARRLRGDVNPAMDDREAQEADDAVLDVAHRLITRLRLGKQDRETDVARGTRPEPDRA